jgi:hypothetical protein
VPKNQSQSFHAGLIFRQNFALLIHGSWYFPFIPIDSAYCKPFVAKKHLCFGYTLRI